MSSTPDTPPDPAVRATAEVTGMFDRIASRYDFLNHLLSCGVDFWWRRQLSRRAVAARPLRIIDIGTGSGDQAISLARHNKDASITGIDLSQSLLSIARRKVEKRGLNDRIELNTAGAQDLPLNDGEADVVSMSFLIRNLPDPAKGLAEAFRVLRPGGRLLVLEFGLPSAALIRIPYLFYLRHLLPPIGRVLSGDPEAYRYLNQTIETFPHGEAFTAMMEQAGFESATFRPLTLGVVYLYEARKCS